MQLTWQPARGCCERCRADRAFDWGPGLRDHLRLVTALKGLASCNTTRRQHDVGLPAGTSQRHSLRHGSAHLFSPPAKYSWGSSSSSSSDPEGPGRPPPIPACSPCHQIRCLVSVVLAYRVEQRSYSSRQRLRTLEHLRLTLHLELGLSWPLELCPILQVSARPVAHRGSSVLRLGERSGRRNRT